MPRAADTYAEGAPDYWDYQRRIGEVGGELNLWKFTPHIGPDDVVVDFGCGGGFLLSRLPGREKIGVEPSPLARAEATRRGLSVVADIDELPEGKADIVVSNHALEHTLAPLDELRGIARALRPGGRLVLVVPIDDWRSQRHANPRDLNQHLYTWTPQLITNLLREAGFDVERAEVVSRAWNPRITPLVKERLPRALHELSERLLSIAKRRRELHAIACPVRPLGGRERRA